MDQQEIEWQFSVDDVSRVANCLTDHASQLGVTVQPAATDNIHDFYFDTADWHVFRIGYALRLRVTGSLIEATLKSLDKAGTGARQRREITEDLPASASPVGAENALAGLMEANGPVGQLVRRVAGKHPIQLLFELFTKRATIRVETDESAVGLVALDETEIQVGNRRTVRLNRVEVEVKQGALDDLVPFVGQFRDLCDLRPVGWSKYQMGLAARGVTPGEIAVAGPTEVEPTASIGDLALVTLRRHFSSLLSPEPAVRLGEDTKAVHRMRVATRRLRSALKLFRDYLPNHAVTLGEELRWLAGALGAARDLDIQLGHLDEWSAAAPAQDREALDALRKVLAQQRANAQEELLALLDNPRYKALVESFAVLLRGPGVLADQMLQPAINVAPKLAARRYRKTCKLGDALHDKSPLDEYHALRKQLKRLRYALEAVSSLYGKRLKPFIRRLETVQALLGELQDANASMRRLRALCVEQGSQLPPLAVYTMGSIAERYQQQAQALQAKFPKVYLGVKGKAWAQCLSVMRAAAKRA